MTTLNKIIALTARNDTNLVQDSIGMLAIVVMLVVGLHLPVLV